MSLVVVSVDPKRIKKNKALWGEFTVWTPMARSAESKQESIRVAYEELAHHAVDEEWDETTMVIQDDIKLIGESEHVGHVTSYSAELPGTQFHCCPRAFTATRTGWKLLTRVWSVPGQTCVLWRPDMIYDLVEVVE